MQIDTLKTVKKTLSKYHWDDLANWTQRGTFLTRHIYRDENLVIYQQMHNDDRQVIFETPKYTLYISNGLHQELTAYEKGKKIPYYTLSVETTINEKNVYRSLIDEAGYQNIEGNRQHILDFEKMLPRKYFSLIKDEEAPYVSTLWMRPGYQRLPLYRPFLRKEKS